MEELEIGAYLINEDLFKLFKKQLKKDFETSGVEAGFAENLLPEWLFLKEVIGRALKPVSHNNSLLTSLLYRVDINETEIQHARALNGDMAFEELMAELIIKRILQKVVLKKKFSV
ncbi:MAG: hypothetical protein V4635_00325 [Bacteroidota bacterium]